MIFTMQLLLSFNVLGAKDESSLPDLGVTTPSFWILSITYSGLYALICIWLARFGVLKGDYLVHYGLEDILWVWVISIGIGAGLYLLLAWLSLEHRRKTVPSATDDPMVVLDKMANNHMGLMAPEVRFTVNNTPWRGFAIEPIEDGKTQLWVAPQILAEWANVAEALPEQTNHNTDLATALNPNATTPKDQITRNVKDRIVRDRANHWVDTRWNPQGNIATVAGPTHIKMETITSVQPAVRIIT